MYITKCPKCKKDGQLYIIGLEIVNIKTPLHKDGFTFDESEIPVDTNDEWVECSNCKYEFPLADVTE